MRKYFQLAAVAAVFCSSAFSGTISSVTVNGNDNPFLAGHPNGTLCCSGDSAPAHSPDQVTGLPLFGGQILTFSVAVGGFFSHVGGVSGPNADGGALTSSGPWGTGIGGYTNTPVDALMGVFLTNSVPSGAPPANLNFGAGGLTTDFASLSPQLLQVFFIGNGLRADASTVQQFVVPSGATRLFLASSDGFGWFNNSGAHNVTINFQDANQLIPEPSTWILLSSALVIIGALRRRI